MEVGIRELKRGLSRYLKVVQAGTTIVVTDRGRPVARIVPAGFPEEIRRLMAEGRVTWDGVRFRPPRRPARLEPGPPLSDYIAEERR